jgi:hypothetical protein
MGCLFWLFAITGWAGPEPQDPDEPSRSPPEAAVPARKTGYTLEGCILDAWGCPIVGARAILFANRLLPEEKAEADEFWSRSPICFGCLGFPREESAIASTVSGPDGWYRFEGLKHGPYTLRVTASGHGYAEREVLVGMQNDTPLPWK